MCRHDLHPCGWDMSFEGYGSGQRRLELAIIQALYHREILVQTDRTREKLDGGRVLVWPPGIPHVGFVENPEVPPRVRPKDAVAVLLRQYGASPRRDKVGAALKHLSEYDIYENARTAEQPKWTRGLIPDWERYYAHSCSCGNRHTYANLPSHEIMLNPMRKFYADQQRARDRR